MITKFEAKRILKTYGQAWENQDPELILTIFTKDATYQERAFEKPFRGHLGIRKYWKQKVCKEQKNIKFRLLDFWISKNIIIAEFEAKFDDLVKKCRKRMRTVALLEIENGKIKSLREYWHSTIV